MSSLGVEARGGTAISPSSAEAGATMPPRTDAAVLARALTDPAGAPPAPGSMDASRLLAAAAHHRILLLTGWVLRASGRLREWPQQFVEAFHATERDAIAIDCLRHSELARALEAMTSAGLRVLVFKGAALAQRHYPAPHLRPRADTDLLAAPAEVAAVEDVLARLGYVRENETSGRLVSYQSHFYKIDGYRVGHAFDVHWKISNLQALSDRFTHQELWENRVPLSALGASAFTPSDAHALLLALVHRAGHHPGSRNLLWMYDVHLLATRLSAGERQQVEDIAVVRGLGQLVADGLALARDSFGTTGVESLISALRAAEPPAQKAMIVDGPWTQAHVLRLDLAALPGWRARARLLREHLLPPPRYMRARYGIDSNLLLPALYCWRVLHGAPKWLRRRVVDD